MQEQTASKYNVLRFVEELEKSDPDRYAKMKKEPIAVSIVPPNRSYGDDILSAYAATWEDIQVCVIQLLNPVS